MFGMLKHLQVKSSFMRNPAKRACTHHLGHFWQPFLASILSSCLKIGLKVHELFGLHYALQFEETAFNPPPIRVLFPPLSPASVLWEK